MKLSNYPSLRLLIPFIGGILVNNAIRDTQIPVSLLTLLFALSLIVTVLLLLCGKKVAGMYGMTLMVTFFFYGLLLSQYNLRKVHIEWPKERRIYTGLLKEYPIEKENSYRLDLEIADTLYGGSDIILYVPKDSAVLSLSPGQFIAFKGRIQPPSNESIEGDFDYATYLYRNGISGTLWVNSSNWKPYPDSTAVAPLNVITVKCRKRILDKYREWGLKDEVLAVVAAVTIGYKNELTDELRAVYSSSGASHVLAVSGLHIGILFAVLSFFFPLSMNRVNIRWVKELIVMILMWCYAFMIGMPYSITRALIMFSILSICRSIRRENSSINALSFAALVILMADTDALFDIGFQLSFAAVLSILLTEPGISKIFRPKNALLKYLWGIVAVSVAAQIGTAPLVILNFSNFSTYFLLTNIVVIPMMFVAVFLSVLMLAFSFIPPIRSLFVWTLSRLVEMINEILSSIVRLPYSTLTIEQISPFTVCCIYMAILFLYLYIVRKRTTHIVHFLTLIAIWSVVELCHKLGWSISLLFE